MQSKKHDLKTCWAGHSITKWTSVSTEFNQHNLQVWKWYGVFDVLYSTLNMQWEGTP